MLLSVFIKELQESLTKNGDRPVELQVELTVKGKEVFKRLEVGGYAKDLDSFLILLVEKE